jgi:hypothetical protein
MRDHYRLAAIAALAALAAGCASTPRSSESAGPARGTRTPVVYRPIPVESSGPLFGRTADGLVSLLGEPALDVREGSARKLQFPGATCVLDTYLYPPRERAEPVVSHIDARLPDGRDTDREACIASLRRR